MQETNVQNQAQRAPQQAHKTEEAAQRVYMPRVDIAESNDAFVVLADMPGVDEKNVEIVCENDTLTIRGKVEPQEFAGHRSAWQEYGEGNYERAFTLSNDVDRDGISAVMKNGVLKLTLPKGGPAKTRKIEVKAE
jgi:HSP20 family protein